MLFIVPSGMGPGLLPPPPLLDVMDDTITPQMLNEPSIPDLWFWHP